MKEPFRVTPPGSPADYDTFTVRQFVRPSPCAEVGCTAHEKGWRTTRITGSEDEDFLLKACRGEVDGHRRHFAKIPQDGGFALYVFEPGQTCFAVSSHEVFEQRPPLFLRRKGDWRAVLGQPVVYDRDDQWADDLHTRHDNLTHLRETRS